MKKKNIYFKEEKTFESELVNFVNKEKKNLLGYLNILGDNIMILTHHEYNIFDEQLDLVNNKIINHQFVILKLKEFIKIGNSAFLLLYISENNLDEFIKLFFKEVENNYILSILKRGELSYAITIRQNNKKKTKILTIKIVERFFMPSDFSKFLINNEENLLNFNGLFFFIEYLYEKIIKLTFRADIEVKWKNNYFPLLLKFLKDSASISGLIYSIYMKTSITTKEIAFERDDKHTLIGLLGQFKKEDDKIRPSYFGGRTEIFQHANKTDDSKYYMYDVNNFYPYIMKEKKMPISGLMPCFADLVTETRLREFIADGFGFAKIRFFCPKNLKYPLLLSKDEEHRNYAAIGGPHEGTYFFPEILKAITLGYSISILEFYKFLPQNIFKKFIEVFEYNNNNKNKKEKTFFKILINRLYGYFGINYYSNVVELYNLTYVNSKDAIHEDLIEQIIDVDEENIILKKEKKTNKRPNVAISSAITAYGRLLLYDWVDKEKENLVYIDTDCFVTNRKLEETNLNTTMGNLKDVYSNNPILDAIFISPKFYCLKLQDKTEILVIKGFDEKEFIWNFNSLKSQLIKSITENKTHITLISKKNEKFVFEIGTKHKYNEIKKDGKIVCYPNHYFDLDNHPRQ